MPRMLALLPSTLWLLMTSVGFAPAPRADIIHTDEVLSATTTWTPAGSPRVVVGSVTCGGASPMRRPSRARSATISMTPTWASSSTALDGGSDQQGSAE